MKRGPQCCTFKGKDRMKWQDQALFRLACKDSMVTGGDREHPIAKCAYRMPFERDRDRIIHSKFFRRLAHKSQIFIAPHTTTYRNRLTHTLEVMQIARSLALSFNLNETLTEAIALGHDLGHPPFGHVGEEALRDIVLEKMQTLFPTDSQDWKLKRRGFLNGNFGFEHNEQSVRVVEWMEDTYASSGDSSSFAQPKKTPKSSARKKSVETHFGLNLTRQVRTGILRHTHFDRSQYPDHGCQLQNHRNDGHPHLAIPANEAEYLELRIVDIADGLAYLNHDIEDARTFGLIKRQHLPDHLLVKRLFDATPRERIAYCMDDLAQQTRQHLREATALGNPSLLLRYSPEVYEVVEDSAFEHGFKSLFKRYVFEHPFIQRKEAEARQYVQELFKMAYGFYEKYPAELPDYLEMEEKTHTDGLMSREEKACRAAMDRISSLTDDQALDCYREFCTPESEKGRQAFFEHLRKPTR